jgi:hypothetical protein
MRGPTCIFWANLTPFSLKAVLTPLVLVVGTVSIAAPLWNALRRKLPQRLWDKVPVSAPRRLDCRRGYDGVECNLKGIFDSKIHC